MKQPKYVYNAKTFQYEHARPSAKEIIAYVLAILFTGTLLFVAIVFLHNRFVVTEYEASLRAENKVLISYLPVLERDLSAIESTLSDLQHREQTLYTKFFNSAPPLQEQHVSSLSKEKVLLADASSFQSLINTLSQRSGTLFDQSVAANIHHSESINFKKEEVDRLTSIPSIQPIENNEINHLVSGFGQRINPFHKGSYFHPGVDFVAPRGTKVFAAGPGKVQSISKSDLQAGYGNQLVIDHGQGIVTRYPHLDEVLVKTGQTISKGMVIGTVGNSGGSIAPHLHFEVIRDGNPVNPVHYFMEGLSSGQHQHLKEIGSQQNQSMD